MTVINSDELIKKIKDKTALLGVIGLGYVGLPLAVEKAKCGYNVIGFDISKNRVDMVNQGINYIGDVVDDELKQLIIDEKITASTNYDLIEKVDCIAICVPSPLDKHYQPDISYIQKSTEQISKKLKKGVLVVLESTSFPGTTEEIVKPILEKNGRICGKDFYLAFSPERVDPGNKRFNTKNTPKVVGGVDKVSTEIAATLYGEVLDGEIFTVSSPAVAEMEKILENTFRNINIGLANEMAILCHKMGIDIWEVIEAAKTKPYGFMPFTPGPGIGGHCIPIDPFYLTWKAREYRYHTRLIEVSSEINNYMPEYIVERALKILNRFEKSLKSSKILVLGVAYKPDISDYRESPSLEIIELLENYGAYVSYNDPHVAKIKRFYRCIESVKLTEQSLSTFDLAIILTMHTAYDYDFIVKNSVFVFDTRNATRNIESSNIEKI